MACASRPAKIAPMRRPPPRPPAAPASPASTRAAALRLLARRDYTTVEIRDRLEARGHDASRIDAAIDGLVRDGAIDDRRAAHAHVRVASRLKGRGVRRIRLELEARGLSKAIIDDALDEVSEEDAAAAIARVLSRRRVTRTSPLDERRRAFQHLLRRGFPADAIARALRLRGADDE